MGNIIFIKNESDRDVSHGSEFAIIQLITIPSHLVINRK